MHNSGIVKRTIDKGLIFARLPWKMPIAGEEVVVVVVRPIAGEQWAYMGESGSSRESTQVQGVQKHK